MNKNYMLEKGAARRIYDHIADAPIYDYHCHLSPQEIFEDKPFDNIGEMWLKYDHYKWRLMRTAGLDEELITGSASYKDKFIAYAKALEFAAGNPLYHWSHMELSRYFAIDETLTAESAERIWESANRYIKENQLSPRKLISASDVKVICTTDDITDDLSWHKKIKEDATFNTRVIPSFRTDNLMLMLRDGYSDYIKKLADASGVEITDLSSLKAAVEKRLCYFAENGCRFSDIGVPYFPDSISDDETAGKVFKNILNRKKVAYADFVGLAGNMYVFLGKLYKKHDIVMQLHLSVIRNSNSVLFSSIGTDCGADCVGDALKGADLIRILDAINTDGGLPQTVIYTLNSSNAAQIASIAGSFQNVRCGAAWWFCDHKRGIEEQIDIIAENSCLGTFLGMLTDSRSFLSYARHDYFRRILCNKLGRWVESGEYDEGSATRLANKICYENIMNLIGGAE